MSDGPDVEVLPPCSAEQCPGSYWEYDARDIPLCRVCDKCRDQKLSKYRPDVLTDSDYWHDEPLDEEY